MDVLLSRIAENKPDIIPLTEIKPKNGEVPDPDSLQINGYDLFVNESYTDPLTRGVCVYVRNELQASVIDPCEKTKFKDCVWLCIPQGNNKFTLFGNIYRSGTTEKARALDGDLHDTIRHLSLNKQYDNIIITGDFNHRDVKWKEHVADNPKSADEDFIECLNDCFLYQMVENDTRITKDEKSLLDLILTNDTDTISNIEYNPHIGNSDHITLNFEVNLCVLEDPDNDQVRYKYHKADVNKLKHLFNIDWDTTLANKTPEEAYQIFCRHYNEALKQCVPKSGNKIKHILPNKPVWMSYNTVKLIKEKQSAWVRYMNTKHPNLWEVYKTARNRVSHAIMADRRRYERGIALEIRHNVKAFWKYVNKNKKLRKKIPNLLRKDKTLACTDKEKADALNSQFQSVFTQEDKNIPEFAQRTIEKILTEIIITEEIIIKKLKNLRIDKSPGPDNIHPYILNNCASELSKPLKIIYMSTLQSGNLPSIWKQGLVSPLFKKGKKNLPSNYRPVCLTSIPCKILESIIVDAIQMHILENQLSNKKQHGFTKRRSTETNLLQAINIWLEALSHGIPVDVIYFDYEKAFDKVPHQRLLKQLESIGIKSQVLNWIRSFLSGRSQRVVVNGTHSNPVNVTSGVPQGSVLGPILFLLYIMNVTEHVDKFMSLFADDSKLFAALLDHDRSTTELQEDINSLARWSNKMMMSFNTDKCHTLHLGRNNPICEDPTASYFLPIMENVSSSQTSTSYDLKCYKLKAVEAEKDLGVIVDNRLTFNYHIDSKIAKANSMVGIIRRTFKYIDKDIFTRLYKAIVRPHVEYADIVWSPTTKLYQDKLEKLQRRATRLIPSLSHLSYCERLRELGLPTLKYRRLRSSLIFLYKYTHNLVDIDLDSNCPICPNANPLQPSLNQSSRGHNLKFQIQHHLGAKQKFFTAKVLPIWNKLKSSTVNATSLNAFKNQLSTDAAMPGQFDYVFSY